MTPSYASRLVLLSSASFFLLHIALGSLVALFSRAAIRKAGALTPHGGARFLLTLRLLPSALSLLAVMALVIPSYLRFEPSIAAEEVDFPCLSAAALGVALAAWAIFRSLLALRRTAHYGSGGTASIVAGEPVWIVKHSAGLALSGVLNPRLLISEQALRELSPEHLAVAIQHERAHRASRDNFKRLLMLLSPFPFLRPLEQAWATCAEWAADDQAAQGDVHRSTALAEALVRVARLQSGRTPQLVTCLVEADENLSVRIDRLLASPVSQSNFPGGAIFFSATALFVLLFAVTPGCLRLVHQLLERLLD